MPSNYYIIDQINPNTGEFDEHKLVKGGGLTILDAALVYLSNYEPNWQGLGAISEATLHVFDLWLRYGDKTMPFSISDFAEKTINLSSTMVGDSAPDPSKSRHWITARGSHILVNGNGEVVGGAGGKLAGRKFSVPSGSKDVSKHIETVEKIAQAGYDKHGGDKAEYLRAGRNKGSSSDFARKFEKTGDIPDGHLREAVSTKPKKSGLSQEYLDSKIVPIAEDEHGRSLSKGKRGFIASNAYGNVSSFDTEAKAVKWINKESKGSGLPDFNIDDNRKFDSIIPEEVYGHYGVDVSKSLKNKTEKQSDQNAKQERGMAERDRRAYYSNMPERDRDAAVRNLFDDALMDKPFIPTHVDSATGKPLQEIQEYMKDSDDETWLVKGHKDEDGNFYRGNSFDNGFVHPVSKKDYEQIKPAYPNATPSEQSPTTPTDSNNQSPIISPTPQVETGNEDETMSDPNDMSADKIEFTVPATSKNEFLKGKTLKNGIVVIRGGDKYVKFYGEKASDGKELIIKASINPELQKMADTFEKQTQERENKVSENKKRLQPYENIATSFGARDAEHLELIAKSYGKTLPEAIAAIKNGEKLWYGDGFSEYFSSPKNTDFMNLQDFDEYEKSNP